MEFSEVDFNEEDKAKLMAALTFQMEKFCQIKENFFTAQRELTPTEFRCLRFLRANPVLNTKEIAIQMNLSQGRITHLLNSLENKGFIQREADKKDRRVIKVGLAKGANVFIDKVIKDYIALHEDIINYLPDENKEEILFSMKFFFDALRKWADRLEDN